MDGSIAAEENKSGAESQALSHKETSNVHDYGCDEMPASRQTACTSDHFV